MATTTLTPTSASAETPKLVKKGSSSDVKSAAMAAQTSFACSHIKNLLQNGRQPAIDAYTRIIHSIRDETNFSASIYKTGSGASASSKNMFLCLQCPVVSSAAEKHKNHAFAVESQNGFILCHDCKDFVYDPTLEEIRSPNNSKKRKYSVFSEPGDKRLVATNSTTAPCAAVGLRGLYNMGQTCFMSVILQSLIHNPFIRAWYLGEGHRSSECPIEACTSCALDDIFTDFYGQEKHEGYGAVHMLQGCWKNGGRLAGYSQQDAHEYLGFILNSLHTANTTDSDSDSSPAKPPKPDQACPCITHQTFSGTLASTVTCTACHTLSTTLDPFTDLSLDIRAPPTHTLTKKKKLSMINGTTTVKETLPLDLAECLARFTAPENLPSDSYHCRRCGRAQQASKRLHLATLPPVLPIHLKRFSHSKSLATSTKVDTKIRFPFILDLEPYTAAPEPSPRPSKQTEKEKDKEKEKEKTKAKSAAAADDDDDHENHDREKDKLAPPIPPIYALSSIIVHKGKIDNGHYISYSRLGDEWFRFDDSMVVQVTEKEVLAAEAYMLFYVVEGI